MRKRRNNSFSNRNGRSNDGKENANLPKKLKYDGKENANLPKTLKYDCNGEPFEKDFFEETPTMANRSAQEIAAYRSENEITIEGNNIPGPIMKFSDYELPDSFMEKATKQNFECPTPIQAQSWPVCLSGRDLIGIARTGSGKTLAYILPAIVHIKNQRALSQGDGPIALILAPTRELAQQIHNVIQEFGFSSEIRTTCVFGGTAKRPQVKNLKHGSEICVATPGRLIDLLSTGHTSMNRCTYLCLDEADRMLDMGFEPQIKQIIQRIQPCRQTLMFSATWPKQVQKLAKKYLNDAVLLHIGSKDLAANPNILQIVDVCTREEKVYKLASLLEEIVGETEHKIIIFVRTKRGVKKLTKSMIDRGWPATCIHGNKSQLNRNLVLNEFRTGKSYILVATDVAARGLDVDDVKFVINYDYPHSSEDYVHRIGRTARHEKKGTAYTFFTADNCKEAKGLIGVLTEAKQRINPELYALLGKKCK